MCLELQWNGRNKINEYLRYSDWKNRGTERGEKECLKYSEWSYCETGDKRFGYRIDAIIELEIKRAKRFVC